VPALRDAAQLLETDIKMMIKLYQMQLAEGGRAEPPQAAHCREEVDMLLACIDDLIAWRESNPLPA
jgi:hypothetical protein